MDDELVDASLDEQASGDERASGDVEPFHAVFAEADEAGGTGVWRSLFNFILPANFMKLQSLQQSIRGMEPALFDLLSATEKRGSIVEFTQTSLRRINAYPRPFVFFTGRPKHCKNSEPVMVIIDDKLHMILVRPKQQLRMQGRVCYFLKKSVTVFHFGLSTELFVKIHLTRPCVHLHRIIEGFLDNPQQDPFPLLFDCLREFRATGDSPVFRDYFLGLVITPNLELVLRIQRAAIDDPELKRRLAESLLILTARSHVALHLLRGLLVPYFASLEHPRDFFGQETMANFFLSAIPRVFARKELSKAGDDIAAALRAEVDPAVYLKRVARQIRGLTLPAMLLKLAKDVWGILVRRYGYDDVDSPLIIYSGFLFYHGLRGYLDGAPEAKVGSVHKLLMMDPTDPPVSDCLPVWKKVVAKFVDARIDNRKSSGLSGALGTAAFDSLLAILTKKAALLKDCCSDVAPDDVKPAMTTVLEAIFTEFDLGRARTPIAPCRIRLDPEKLEEWRRDHGPRT
jgi:hypothetical protein